MKRKLWANIQLFVMLAISVAITVVVSVYADAPVFLIVMSQIGGLLGSVCVRFAYEIALLSNVMHSCFQRNNDSSLEDDEPSGFAVVSLKIAGYVLFILQVAMLFTFI